MWLEMCKIVVPLERYKFAVTLKNATTKSFYSPRIIKSFVRPLESSKFCSKILNSTFARQCLKVTLFQNYIYFLLSFF